MNQQHAPRKVLLILEATLGGTGRHILDLAEGLLSRSDEVHLVYSLLRSDVQFREGLQALREKHRGFKLFCIAIERTVGWADFKAYWRLLRYMRTEGPFDVIHSHSTKAGFLARLLIGTRRAAQIYTPHGLMTNDPLLVGLKRKAVCWLESILARRTKAVVVVSTTEYLCARQTGLPQQLLVRIPNGVCTATLAARRSERRALRARLGIAPDALVVGFVGRLCDHKNPYRMIEAFAALKKAWRGSMLPRLVIIGSGPMEEDLRRLVKERQLSGEVIWAGAVSGTDHACVFDVLGHTSRSEGFGYVFLEALASGVPIVTTRVGAVEELGINGLTGLVCDPWNSETFAEMLGRLLSDESLRSALSRNALQVSARFDLRSMIESISGLYDRVSSHEPAREEIGIPGPANS
jgi:glycosyltransferase involved in cell wall biosynthesis